MLVTLHVNGNGDPIIARRDTGSPVNLSSERGSSNTKRTKGKQLNWGKGGKVINKGQESNSIEWTPTTCSNVKAYVVAEGQLMNGIDVLIGNDALKEVAFQFTNQGHGMRTLQIDTTMLKVAMDVDEVVQMKREQRQNIMQSNSISTVGVERDECDLNRTLPVVVERAVAIPPYAKRIIPARVYINSTNRMGIESDFLFNPKARDEHEDSVWLDRKSTRLNSSHRT